jgi:hypothetical protein
MHHQHNTENYCQQIELIACMVVSIVIQRFLLAEGAGGYEDPARTEDSSISWRLCYCLLKYA